jgi:hypothetical protein
MTLLQNKIIPVALVAALLGGSVGAIVSRRSPETATTSYSKTAPAANLFDGQNTRQVADGDNAQLTDDGQILASKTENAENSDCYRDGFLAGFNAARDPKASVTERTVVPANRVVYRNAPARNRSYSRASNSRQVYYDYNTQPRKRSFWQKHRDKLTVAMGAGGGALVGALVGGKKGAAIGALAGGGGAALYTYKIRKRNRNY